MKTSVRQEVFDLNGLNNLNGLNHLNTQKRKRLEPRDSAFAIDALAGSANTA
jgi:hypothetical protein